MAKRIVINPLFSHIQGKYNLKDEDGCPTPFTLREMAASGHVALQVGENKTRNLEQKPYTQKELVQQSKFRQAAAQTKLVLADTTQKAKYQAEFSVALKNGVATQSTLRGYIFSKLCKDAQYVPSDTPSGGNGGNTPNTPTGGDSTARYTMTVSADPAIGGTVNGAGEYRSGEVANITATANSGYKFLRWSDNNTSASRSVTMTEDKILTAYFQADSEGGDNSGW